MRYKGTTTVWIPASNELICFLVYIWPLPETAMGVRPRGHFDHDTQSYKNKIAEHVTVVLAATLAPTSTPLHHPTAGTSSLVSR